MAAFVAATGAALLANANLLSRDVVEGDALVHQYWMRRFEDPELFRDPLTSALRESERYPDGYEGLFWVATQLGADPISFGEWLGIALMAAAGLLVFAIVRTHTDWRPAAWIAAAVFLVLDGHRFYGGFPRGFVHVIVLGAVLLALRRRELAAALVAGGGALIYPPAALLASGTLIVSAARWRERRPAVDRRRLAFGALALVLAAAIVVVPSLISGGGTGGVLTADEARRFPEFGSSGPLHFFVDSTLEYLRQNRSGFDLRGSGSILVLAAAALLLLPTTRRVVRAEVLALPVASLAAFAAAHAVLFRLYLPHRYTYPLVAFAAIVVGVALRPAYEAALARRWSRPEVFALLLGAPAVTILGLYVFPLGPTWSSELLGRPRWVAAIAASIGLALAGALLLPFLARRRAGVAAAVGALLSGALLLGGMLQPERRPPGQTCAEEPVMTFLQTLPKDAIVAGDPLDLKCVVFAARRPVVISSQLAPSYEADYFRRTRERMFTTLRAVYGPTTEPLGALRGRYGATHLWIRRGAVRAEFEGTEEEMRWDRGKQPYTRLVRSLLERGTPAVLDLPRECRRFADEGSEVYDLACLDGR